MTSAELFTCDWFEADPVNPGDGVSDVLMGSDPDPLHLNAGEFRQEAMAGSTTNQDGPHHLADGPDAQHERDCWRRLPI